MGAIASIIEGADKSEEKEKEMSAKIDLLYALGDANAQLMKNQIYSSLRNAGKGEDLTVPITKVLSFERQISATTSKSADKMVDEIKAGVNAIVDENISTGVANIVQRGMKMLLGAGDAAQSSFEKYFITVEGYAILRYDIMGWRKSVEGTGITTSNSKILAFTMVKSSVDVQSLELNEILSLYSEYLLKDQKETLEVLKERMEQMKEIYSILKDGSDHKTKVFDSVVKHDSKHLGSVIPKSFDADHHFKDSPDHKTKVFDSFVKEDSKDLGLEFIPKSFDVEDHHSLSNLAGSNDAPQTDFE